MPKIAPVAEDGRQRHAHLDSAEMQEPVSRAAGEGLLNAARQLAGELRRSLVVREQEVAVRRKDGREGGHWKRGRV